jgi:NADH:ubiquinone oxidoreductase subunit C
MTQLTNQTLANEVLQNTFAHTRKFNFDKVNEPILWAMDPKDAVHLIKKFQEKIELKINFLSDITAYDNSDKGDGEDGRFVVVIQLLSTETLVRIRIKVLLKLGQDMETLTGIWPAANWLEREVFDMYGIGFSGHPNLKRILMDERFSGNPLRKEYYYKQREPFSDNVKINLAHAPREKSSHE